MVDVEMVSHEWLGVWHMQAERSLKSYTFDYIFRSIDYGRRWIFDFIHATTSTSTWSIDAAEFDTIGGFESHMNLRNQNLLQLKSEHQRENAWTTTTTLDVIEFN